MRTLILAVLLALHPHHAHAGKCPSIPSPPTILDVQPLVVGYQITVNLPTDGSFNNDPNTGIVAIYRFEPVLSEYVADLGVFLSGSGTSVTAVLPGPFTIEAGDVLAARVGDVRQIGASGADQAWSGLSAPFIVP